MKPDHLSFVSQLDEEDLYRQARAGYLEWLQKDPGVKEELGVPISEIQLVERHVKVVFPKAWGPTVEVRIDIKSRSGAMIGYYALILEEDFSVQDDFFVIHP